MASIRLIPSTHYLSSSQYLSVSNENRMYNNTDNTNYATVTNSQNGTTSYYIYLRGFNFSDIPSGAIINSFNIKLKAYESGVSTNANYVPCLCNGTTTIANTSSDTITTSVQTLTFPNGNLTFDTIKSYGSNFGIRINCRRNNRNTTAYMYIYGAEIDVDYTLPIYHQITSISNTDLVDTINPEGTTSVVEGENYTLDIYANSISNVVVKDNDNDVTSLLVKKSNTGQSGTISAVAGSDYETGGTPNGVSFYTSSLNQTLNYLQYPIGYTAENPRSTSSTYTYVKSNSSESGSTGWITFNFDFSSIPSNAQITSVSVRCYGSKESLTQSTTSVTRIAKVGLYSGDNLKSSEQEFTSTSNTIMTISNPGTWTREELQNAKLRFSVGYYGGFIAGITWDVSYTIPSDTDYYWSYTLTNVTADHTIVIEEGVIIPPEEDPEKEYYPITISSINASTDPNKGTVRLESGTTQVVTITPTDPKLTLAIDNGVDITSQLVAHHGEEASYTVTTAPNASYGFTLNSSTGYYTSSNKGVDSSAAVARVNLNLPVRCLITFTFINNGEETYDFGVFGKVDTTLSTTGWTASDSQGDITTDAGKEQLRLNTSSYNTTTPQTLTYELNSGEHYIDIKYGKDQATSNGNDTLQFKIDSIQELESNNYYTYTLSGINQSHSLIFIFGDVSYYIVNSSTNSDCKLYPNGQMVQMPQDDYKLTIVPNNNTDTISITDNGTDTTSSLIRKEISVEKEGQTIVMVNYIYNIDNIQGNHTLFVSSLSHGLNSYLKNNSIWNISSIKKKEDNRWKSINHTRIWVFENGEWIENKQGENKTKGIIFGGNIA